jgi:pimeloyl-ACP methyl ester carboxylesterase
MIRWLRRSMALTRAVHPPLAAWWAERLFFTPPRARSRRIEAFLAGGQSFAVRSGGRRIAAWRWGHGPTVLLVHGWGGLGGQLSEMVDPLVRAGFTVVAFDAPGHGRSGRGMTSLVDFARAVDAITRAAGPLYGVVTHSLGGAAIAFALRRGLRVERAVFICPPARPVDWARTFADRLGVADDVMALMRRRAEKRLGVAWSDLDIPSFAGSLTTGLLVIHDKDDADVQWSDGELLARSWPGAELVTTTGLGHRRILRDPGVVERAVAFLSSGRPETPTEAELLEAELFEPARRFADA